MELKPCPRCQSESNLHDYHGEIAPICWKCRLSGPYFQTSDEAIEWWNTRSTDPLMKEMAEAISWEKVAKLTPTARAMVCDLIERVWGKYNEREGE